MPKPMGLIVRVVSAMDKNDKARFLSPILDKMVLRFEYDDTLTWLIKEETVFQTGNIRLEQINEISDKLLNAESIIVLLKGFDLEIRQVLVPLGAPQDQLRALIKFKIEEELLDDLDSIKFFILDQVGETITIAIMSQSIVLTLKKIFKKIPADRMSFIPDFLAIPFRPNHWTVYIDGEQALIRHQLLLGLAWETRLLGNIFSTLIKNAEQLPMAIDLYGTVSETALSEFHELKIERTQKNEQNLLEQVYDAEDIPPHVKLEVLSTEANNYEKIATQQLRKYLLYGCSALAILTLFFQTTKIFYLESILKKLYADEAKWSVSIYPDSGMVSNLREKIQDDVDEFNKNSSNGFFQLFLFTSQALKEIEQKNIISISYNEQVLDLDLKFKNFNALTVFKDRLLATGVNVEQKSADSTQEGVVAQLLITSG